MKDISKIHRSKVDLEELSKYFNIDDYLKLYTIIMALIEENKIKPVKASGLNGKKPALYNKYHLTKDKEDNSEFIKEISSHLNIVLDKSYYLKNLDKYKRHREDILALSHFLDNKKI